MRSKVVAGVSVAVALLVGCSEDAGVPLAPVLGASELPDETAEPATASTLGGRPSPTDVDVAATEDPVAAPSAVAAAPEPPPSSSPVAVPTVTFERSVEEPDPAYRFEAALPVVRGVPADAAAAIGGQVRAWYDEQRAGFLRDEAEFNPSGQPLDDFPPGWLGVHGETGAVTPTLVSMVFRVSTMHQGAAHPWDALEAFTFDATSGARVDLEELFAPGAPVLETISAQVVPALVAQLDPAGEGWAEAGVREGAAPDAELLRRFVLSADGLTFHFDQYQVAPGAAGTPQVTLAWDHLLGLLPPSPRLTATLAALR